MTLSMTFRHIEQKQEWTLYSCQWPVTLLSSSNGWWSHQHGIQTSRACKKHQRGLPSMNGPATEKRKRFYRLWPRSCLCRLRSPGMLLPSERTHWRLAIDLCSMPWSRPSHHTYRLAVCFIFTVMLKHSAWRSCRRIPPREAGITTWSLYMQWDMNKRVLKLLKTTLISFSVAWARRTITHVAGCDPRRILNPGHWLVNISMSFKDFSLLGKRATPFVADCMSLALQKHFNVIYENPIWIC